MYPLLSIQQLSVDFKTEVSINSAIRNINFQVHRSEIVALVGESGSGKSVTALSLLRLLPQPQTEYKTGKILFSPLGATQADLLQITEQELRQVRGKQISMIFQEPMTSLNPVLTCGEQVKESIQLHEQLKRKEARERTIQLFEKVRLPDPSGFYDRFPHQLSGGQKQRVMIAMAMSCNPYLLICDEPTTALDVTVQKSILELIKELQVQTQMGVIFITHDLGLVGEIADKVVVMYKGEIVEAGLTKDIFTNPSHSYTRALLACRPVLHPKGERLPTIADFIGKDKKSDNGNLEIFLHSKETSDKQADKEIPSQPDSGTVLIDVKELTVTYKGRGGIFGGKAQVVRAVDKVSFQIFRGETLGLVGESGCGKSTLGRGLLKLIPASEGRIIYNGMDLAGISNEAMRPLRKELQIVFQDPYSSLNPRLTIGSALAEPLKVHGIGINETQRNRKVVELLEKVNLNASHANRYPHEFSGGQRQRIVIARALALDPSFIICDESVSALDVSVQAQVLNLLNDLKKEFGFTMVFISHDLSVVHYVSDRIMVMNKGRIEEIGGAEQVYNSPRSEYTRKLLDSIPAARFSR